MVEYRESWLIRFLRWLGIINPVPISNAEMCEQVKNTCNRQCKYCAWYEPED